MSNNNQAGNLLPIHESNGVPTVDSRIIAQELGNDHKSVLQLIDTHKKVIEKDFGVIAFEMVNYENQAIRSTRIANLNEGQALFLATLSRNSDKAIRVKSKIVKSFMEFRNALFSLVNDRNMRVVQIAEGILLNVMPSENHVWIVSTGDLSRGLRISEDNIRGYKTRSNFKEDEHYIQDFPYQNEDKVVTKQTMWTKKGVMEMPNHMRTGYCNELRQWAENQLMGNTSAIVTAGNPVKRRHNRMTPERMLSIMATITKITDAGLRAELVNKLMEGGQS